MKELSNRIVWSIGCIVCAWFLFSGVSVYAAPADQKKISTLTFLDDCTVNQKKSSPEAFETTVNEIGKELVDSFLRQEKKYIRLSPVCEFELGQNMLYTTSTSVEIIMRYQKTEYRPRIFFWNEEKKVWISVETTINRYTYTARAKLKMRKGIVTVFADGSDAYEGVGSWYAHKRYPSGSATNLFPLGTKLKVTNLENKKSTIVAVTSTWTNKDKKRVIDLVSTAFKKIAWLGKGLIRVRIEKI